MLCDYILNLLVGTYRESANYNLGMSLGLTTR